MKTVSLTTRKNPAFLLLLFFSSVLSAQPVARFTASQTTGCVPSVINFTDQSTGNPSFWRWDLGNGTVSYLQNPSATYLVPGQYTVKLVVQNSTGADSVTKIGFISIKPNPSVAFTSDRTVGCYPLPVVFTVQPGTNQTPIRRWEWDFGDGQLSAQQNPTHNYTQSGSFNVTLKVTDTNGCVNSLQKNRYMTINGVTASFSNYVDYRCLSTRVNFFNTSVGNGTLSYQWNLGDGNSSTQQGFVYTYASGGNYNVLLKATNNFGCIDTTTVNIQLDTLVSAAFTSNVRSGCKPPLTVSFSSPAKNGNVYHWEFGDGTISNQRNPTHVYTDTGYYSVKLKVTNPNGCVDSLKISRYIQVRKPFIYIDNLPDSSCLPFTKDFYAFTNEPDDTIARYKWDFGNGNYSTSANPLHTFRQFGYYNIRLIATTTQGCTDTAYFPNGIKVSSKPTASFYADSFNVCGKTAINFTNQSTGANAWQWEFGANGGSTSREPSYKFQDTGWLQVRLIAWNGGCSDTMTRSRYVYIKPAIAKFSFANSCITFNKVKFTNMSKGAHTWLWSFGDGDTSTALHPEHTYRTPGTYTVTLWVKNNTTGCDHEFAKEVTVMSVSSSFTARQTSVCRGGAITFDCLSDSAKISRFFWDFGDRSGVVSTKNLSVSHVYHQPGVYTVKLIAISLTNCRDTIVRSNYITVDGPSAKFGIGSLGACIGRNTIFLDSTVSDGRNRIVDWNWNFGDSTPVQRFTAPPFTHIYNSRGTYFISLKVTDSRGCADSFVMVKPVKTVTISSQILPATNILRCSNSIFNLVCPFAEQGFTYKWELGDGTVANSQYVTKAYANPGVFDVRLVVSNNAGCSDTTTRSGMITIVKSQAKFLINDSFRTCPPLMVNFTDSSSHVVSRVWDFGDSTSTTSNNPSHFYSYPGTYTAKLTVTGPGGCTDVFSRQIVVQGPRGQITSGNQRSCRPYVFSLGVTAQDAVSYSWDFNDGNTLNTNQTSVTHVYQNPGTYIPRIMLVDAAGCRVPVASRDTLLASTITAGFRMETRNTCDTGIAKFISTTTSNDQIVKYAWSFGDGAIASVSNPQHRYAHDGTYSVKLIVYTRTGCTDSISMPVTIKRVPPPGIRIVRTANGCAPLQVQFQGIRSATDTGTLTWKWQFGNGDSSLLQNPSTQSYSNTGTYRVVLSAVNSVGCQTSVVDTVDAFGSPIVKAGADTTICLNRSVVLNASGAATYEWTGTGLSCNNCLAPTITPQADAVYTVKGTATNGCFGRDTVLVHVNRPAKLIYNEKETICKGASKKLIVTGASAYQWSPATGLSNPTVSSPIATPAENITYRVVGNVNNACGNDTAYIHVKVVGNPTVEAGADQTIPAGSFVNLDPVVSADVTEAYWTPTDELSRNGSYGVTVRPSKNTDYTIEVRNADGCVAKDKVAITLTCNANNVFIPNTFSPNNDGMNDVFFIRGIGLYKVRSLRIFNRWGEMVFSKYDFMANDPSMGWDGRYKGARLLTDVFVYIAEIVCGNGTVVPYNGNISLVN